MWTCLKGVPGLRSPSAAVRAEAARLAGELALLSYAVRRTAGAAAPAAPAADVSVWSVCRELVCQAAAADSDPSVVAAALAAADELLAACCAECGPREWLVLVEGVLTAAAAAAETAAVSSGGALPDATADAQAVAAGQPPRTPTCPSGPAPASSDAWAAALAFASHHGQQPGWRAAVAQLRERWLKAAAAGGGPLGAEGWGAGATAAVAKAVAGAAALEAALGRSLGLGLGHATGDGGEAAAGGALPLLGAAAACLSDVDRRGAERAAGAVVEPEGVMVVEEEEDGEQAGPQAEETLATHARLTCRCLGRLLPPADALEALEALVGRAETAPLAPAATGAAPVSSRAGLLSAAAALAEGAAARLRAVAGAAAAMTGTGVIAAAASPSQSPLPSPSAAGATAAEAASGLAVAVRIARMMRRVAALAADPDQSLFSSPGGEPATPAAATTAAAARQHHIATVAAADVLRALLASLPCPLVLTQDAEDGGQPGGDGARAEAGAEAEAEAGHGRSRGGGGRRPRVVVTEVGEGEAAAPSPLQAAAAEWRREVRPLVEGLMLLVATYAPPSASPPPDGGESAAASDAPGADPALPPPPRDTFTPWANADGAAAAAALLAELAARVRPSPPPSKALRARAGGGGGSLALLSAAEVAEQDLIAACLPGLLRAWIRPVVVQKHVQDLEKGPITPYRGPDAFARSVAARRLAWLLMRSRHPFAGPALAAALPCLLAAADDPSPGAAAQGLAALHAAAAECLAADLQWQRELLLETARRAVVGCRGELWALACPAAVALTRRIEGKDPRAPGYHALAAELLSEMERTAHLPERRMPFMPAAARLVTALGLTTVRHLGRLMPLVLDWLHAPDAPTRIGALRLTNAVVRATWPRVPAHAPALWRHVLVVLVRLERAKRGRDEGPGTGVGPGSGSAAALTGEEGEREAAEAAQEEVEARGVCALLLACAGPAVSGLRPAEAGLPAEAERLHAGLLEAGG
ncbi:hypothetical protein HYH03_007867 [Edaphochlamys debaryana]|uniref:Uncharacterized protein n=1 Tax=Edaphochlamys debaryana TaxID=47281 RepID=A0A835Y126_9CHLO|nr:hypothetical protein HYH03_007867 [Edaphochlamys debaryana]|eukprot:KAG2493936.1 hypothetical protein HYH03_007867 [Edaphochlamys debaryana]